MRATSILSLVVLGGAFVALGSPGCSSSPETIAVGGGNPTTTTHATTSTTTTSHQGGGGNGGADNDTFETAADVTVDDPGGWLAWTLDPVDTDVDFFKFDGTAGQALFLMTQCKTLASDPFDPTYPDLVMTIYDQNHTQIAQNDDPIPRSSQDPSLPIILPADGTYYIKIQDFCTTDLANPPCDSTYFDQVVNLDYNLAVVSIDYGQLGNFKETEPNDDAAHTNAVTYEPVSGSPGSYYLTMISGTFKAADDTDYYLLHLPADLNVGAGAPALDVAAYPSGTAGDGATSSIGLMTLWDATGVTKIAEVDFSVGGGIAGPDLTPPGVLDTDYLLSITHSGPVAGAHDYYFLNHGGTSYSNTPEIEPNDTYQTANALTGTPNTSGGNSFYAQGTLTYPAGDLIDSFGFTAVSGQTVTIACGAQRGGSGLRGLQFKVINATTGTDISGSQSTPEVATDDLAVQDLALGAATNLVLQVSAVSQDPTVTSNFYRCGIHTATP